VNDPDRDAPCPTCGAEPGKRCRTLTTHRTTDTHDARWNQWVKDQHLTRRLADETGAEEAR
jgi:hypothetical protein